MKSQFEGWQHTKDEIVTKSCPACSLKFRYHFYPGLKHIACNYCKTDVAVNMSNSIPSSDAGNGHGAHSSPASHGGHGHH